MPTPRRSTRSAHLLELNGDSCSYSFGRDERLCVESIRASYYLKRSRLEWEIISCKKQERKLICNYEYMPNFLQRGAEIYRRHLEMKAKSQQRMRTTRICLQFLGNSTSMYRGVIWNIFQIFCHEFPSLHDII